jgi:predicted DsbA family dithiol-disulfide isomerase
MPLDMDFIVKSAAQSSWPACVAVKAAGLQDKTLAATFFRRLMEAAQLRAANASEEGVYLTVAKEVGLAAGVQVMSAAARLLLEYYY